MWWIFAKLTDPPVYRRGRAEKRKAAMTDFRVALGALATILIALGAAYSNCFDAAFVFDDHYVVVTNPAIRSLSSVWSFFYDPFTMSAWRNNGDLRPIVQSAFALNYAVSGLDPWSYRALSLGFHATSAWLVFTIVRDHLQVQGQVGAPSVPPVWVALGAALLFAVAPLNHQPVVYASARSALMATFFLLAAFRSWLVGRIGLMAVFYALALLSKAIAVTFPLSVLAYDYLYRDRNRYVSFGNWLAGWKRLRRPVGLLVGISVAYLVYRALLLPSGLDDLRHESDVTPFRWMVSQWPALLHYVGQFFWPNGLSIDNDFPYSTLADLRAWVALFGILFWLVVAWRVRERLPAVAFSSFWFFSSLAPESTLAPLAEVVNDHRPYVASSLGLSVLAALGLSWLASKAQRPSRAFCIAILGIVLAAVPVVRHRSWLWHDPVRLWQHTAVTSPNNARAHMNAGQSLLVRGDVEAAAPYLEEAARLAPGYPFALVNMSALRVAQGKPEEALSFAKAALLLDGGSAQITLQVALAQESSGLIDDARLSYRRAIDLGLAGPEAEAGLARLDAAAALVRDMDEGVRLLHEQKQPERALTYFERVLAVQPSHLGALWQSATALTQMQRYREGIVRWEAALAISRAASAVGQEAEANRQLQAALMGEGVAALHSRSEPGVALAQFDRVLELNPNHYGAIFQRARALDASGRMEEGRVQWQLVLSEAERIGDESTAGTARRRLGTPPP